MLNQFGKPLKGSKVLVLGAAYKKDVDDHRESPSIIIIEKLEEKGAAVNYNDPHIPRFAKQREHDIRLESVPLTEKTLAAQDVVIITTDHTAYDYEWIVGHSKVVVDTRNATRNVVSNREKNLQGVRAVNVKVANVVGARPNFMKIAPIMRAMAADPFFEPILIHTGQHYDAKMSDVFFEELGIREPDVNLSVGSGLARPADRPGDGQVRGSRPRR